MSNNFKFKKDFNNFNDQFSVELKDLKRLNNWRLSNSLDLHHVSHGFFTFKAVKSFFNNFLISQNEIGMLAIFCKSDTKDFFEQFFLLQNKFEPGNDPHTQLSPAIQMTYSNLKGKHGGKNNNLNFLDYFSKNLFFSTLQLEQSDSFLHKKNLNYFALLGNAELPQFIANNDLFWISSSEIIQFALRGEILHADTRSVMFFIFLKEFYEKEQKVSSYRDINNLFSLFSFYAFKFQKPWRMTSMENICEYKDGKIYLMENEQNFDNRNILGLSVKSKTREVKNWDQPLLSIEPKTYSLIISKKDNELYFLISIGIGPGLLTEFEILPTFIFNFSEKNKLNNLTNLLGISQLHSSWQTEEGGRFFKRRNLHKIFYSKNMKIFNDEKNLFWINLKEFYNLSFNTNFVSMELRSIGFLLFSHLLKK